MKRDDPPPAPADPFAWPTRRPKLTLILAAVVALVGFMLVRTIDMDGSLESMLPEHDSSSAAMSRVAESFDLANDVTLLVQAPDDQADPETELIAFAQRFESAFASSGLEAQSRCRVRWVWPGDGEAWTREVLLPNLVLYLDKEQQQALRQRLSPAGMAERFDKNERLAASPGLAGSAMSSLLEDPLGLAEFVSASYAGASGAGGGRPGSAMLSDDGRSLLIRVEPVAPTYDSTQANAVTDAVRRAVEQARPGDLRVGVGGGLAIASAAERSIRGDMIISSVGTIVLLQVLFLATYRRLALFPIAFVPAAVGVLVGFALFALTGRALSPPTAVLGALLAGLGIDYAIHYLAHAGGGDPLHAVSRRMSRPLGIACVTSILAFLTLIVSDVAALRDFATVAAVGLSATLITTLFLLPALLALLARFRRQPSGAIATPRWRIDRLVHTSVRHRRGAVVVSLLLAFAALGVLRLHPDGPVAYDSELSNMHPQPNAALQTQRRIADAFPGQGETLVLFITAPTESALIERAARSAERLRADADGSSIVAGVFGVDTLIPTAQQKAQRRAFAQTFDVERVQADFDRAAEDSLFDPEAFAGYRKTLAGILRPGQGPTLADLRGYPGLASGLLPSDAAAKDDDAPYTAISFLSVADPPKTRAERGRMIGELRSALTDVDCVTLTGFTVVGHDIETQVRGELPLLLMIAGGAVVLWLVGCYRDARDVAFALLPVVLGLLMTFALMRLMGIGLNLLNMVALPLLIGLGVDDGVLMVSIARNARRESAPRDRLIEQLSSSAQAVTMTSLTTALAFGSLTLTAVPAIRALGAVMAVGIVACWAVSLGLLAPLLVHGARAARDGTDERESAR